MRVDGDGRPGVDLLLLELEVMDHIPKIIPDVISAVIGVEGAFEDAQLPGQFLPVLGLGAVDGLLHFFYKSDPLVEGVYYCFVIEGDCQRCIFSVAIEELVNHSVVALDPGLGPGFGFHWEGVQYLL